MVVTEPTESRTSLPEEIPVLGFDAVEFYVGNAKQAAYFYNKAMGFDIIAYRGPETGYREGCSYLMAQNDIRFVLHSAFASEHPVNRHVVVHGDGIKDVNFRVDNVEEAFETAVKRGAPAIMAPTVFEDEFGKVIKATIGTYGETTHTFVNRQGYSGLFEPGFQKQTVYGKSTGLQAVDHVVGNVEMGKMEHWVEFYQNVFGFYTFRHYDESDISTQYSALVSKVMANRSQTIKMPINEPFEKGMCKSQIQEYIDYYKSAGVQHVALRTNDILETVAELRDRNIELMTVPDTYYQELPKRMSLDVNLPISELSDLGILVDEEDEGYLLQIFTLPVQDRPTFFYEIIQRCGAEGFGKGNFKALFEAIERDQARRGNL